MKAMVLHDPYRIEDRPLKQEEVEMPEPKENQVLIKVRACGVCRTDLHIIEGELKPIKSKIIPGHEIVGEIKQLGYGADRFSIGDIVGVPWLYSTCGKCDYCLSGRENLCQNKKFTGYSENGGYAEYTVANQDFCFKLPKNINAESVAPLLCSGIIGYHALKSAISKGEKHIGMFGFGSSAHLTLQLAVKMGYTVSVASRNRDHLDMATGLGAKYTYKSDSDDMEKLKGTLDSAIVFAPVGVVVMQALESIKPGGTVVIADIYTTPIGPLDYEKHLFHEKVLTSVEANTRKGAEEYLALAFKFGIKPVYTTKKLEDANDAILDLKKERVKGSVVLRVQTDF
jgi:propanol-preferring alcohol dehydrogenase